MRSNKKLTWGGGYFRQVRTNLNKISQLKVSKWYALIVAVICLLVLGVYYSYAMFTVEEVKSNAISIVTGELNYTLSGITNNRITVAGNSGVSTTITVNSLNSIESKYQLYYLSLNNITVGYVNDNDLPYGQIGTSGTTKTVRIIVTNTSSSSQTVTIGIAGGLVNNELTLEDGQIAINQEAVFDASTKSITGGSIQLAKTSSIKTGETVSFTTTSTSGFSYYGATVLDSSGKTVATLSSSQKSFTMPSSDVVVSPKWKHNDKRIVLADGSTVADTNFVKGKSEGAASTFSFSVNGDPLNFSATTVNNARLDAWSTKMYDLTHYARVDGAVYSNPAAKTAKFSVAVAKTTTDWVFYSTKLTTNKQMDLPPATWVNPALDVTNLSGSYYIGFQYLSQGQIATATMTEVLLIGRVYQ